MNNKRFLLGLIILFGCVFLYSSIRIVMYFIDKSNVDEIQEYTSEYIKNEEVNVHIDFDSLSKVNPDVVGYLKVNNTKIDYVVVKGKDNDYYLNHNFNKKRNVSGWVFADYTVNFDGNDKNIVIYGHNMRNGTMFGTLKNILDKNWYLNEENRKILFVTKEDTFYYEVFSVYSIKSEDYYISTDFKNEESFGKFINTLKKRSKYDFKVDVSEKDEILTLSTCTGNGKNRVVLHARRMK